MNKKYFKLFGVGLLTGLLALSSCDNSRKFSSISDSSTNDDVLLEDFNKLLAPTNVVFDADTRLLSWNTVTGIKNYDVVVNGVLLAPNYEIKTETIIVEEEKAPTTNNSSDSASDSAVTSDSVTSNSQDESSTEVIEKVEVEIIPEVATIYLEEYGFDFDSSNTFLFSVRAKGDNHNSKYSSYLFDKNSANSSKGLFLFSDNTKEVIIGVNPHSAVPLEPNLEIPEGVKEISINAFNKVTSIKSLKLPSTIEKIGEGAFANTRFSKIDLSECSNLVEIGDYSFEKNTNLASTPETKIVLPKSVKRIGTNAFNGSNVIMEVPTDSKLEYLGDYALAGSKITSFYLPSSITYLGEYALSDTNLSTITYADGAFKDEIPNGFFNKTKLVSFNIPSTVKRIGDAAFKGCSTLKYLGSSTTEVADGTFYIPESVEEIGFEAFINLKNVLEVKFAKNSNLKVIGESAFEGLEKITTISLPDSLERIEKDAFKKCKVLNEVKFSKDSQITYISNKAFDDTIFFDETYKDKTIILGKVILQVSKTVLNKKEIDLTDTKTYGVVYGVSDEAFKGAKTTSLVLPDTLKVIGNSAFANCSKITELSLSANIQEIGKSAFSGCEDIETLTIDPNCPITEIKDNTFEGLEKVESIIIPNTVTKIGNSAFESNEKMANFVVPENLEYIGESAFSGCKALTSINLPSTINYLGAKAFKNNVSLETFNFDDKAFENALEEDKVLRSEVFSGCESLVNVSIPVNILKIESSAFKGAKSLMSIDLPDTTTNVSPNAFDGSGISESFVNGFVIVDGLLLKYIGEDTDIVIPGNVRLITNNAFEKTNIQSVVISNTVEAIYDNAFLNCKELKTVSFADNSIITSIGKNAFSNCTSLTTISLPTSIVEIQEYAFYRCINLQSIDLSFDNINKISAHCFEACNSLSNVKFSNTLTEIGEYAFYKTSFTDITLPSNLEVIGDYAFAYLGKAKNKLLEPENWEIIPSLKSLDLTNTKVSSVGEYAFTNNILTDILLPTHELVLKEYCFANSTQLTSFNFNDGWDIQQGVLKGCNNITKLTLGADESIHNIFGGYITFVPTALTEVEIVGDGTTIPDGAFAGLGNLEKVTLTDKITYIGNNAFNGCRNLDILDIRNVEHIGDGAFLGCFSLDLTEDSKTLSKVNYIGEKAFTGTKYLDSFDKDSDGEIDEFVIINGILVLYNGEDADVVIDDSVRIIAGGAFAGNQTIKSLTCGSKLEKICFGSVDSCTNLTSIKLNSNEVVNLDLGTLDTLTSSLKITVKNSLVDDYVKDIYWSLYVEEENVEGN